MNGDIVKIYAKCFFLFPAGLFSSLLIYPLMHEMGHLIFSLAVGFSVADLTFLPTPSLGCFVDTSRTAAVICAGFGGIIFPLLMTSIRVPVRFKFWYIWFVIKGIGIFSILVSFVSIVMFCSGTPLVNDDMTLIMQFAPRYTFFYYVLLMFLLTVTLLQLIRSSPIERCKAYFEL